jgi:hypothetical protein
MQGRTDQLRTAAADYLMLARATTNMNIRVALVTMAQQLLDCAKDRHASKEQLDEAVRGFNDQQMFDGS